MAGAAKGEGPVMGSGEQPGPGSRTDWPVRLATALRAEVGAALALLFRPFIHLDCWPGLLACCTFLVAGIVLGRLAGSHLSRRPPGR
jgi:hypothetical protein